MIGEDDWRRDGGAYCPVGEEPGAVVAVELRADLPAGLDGVEVVAEGAGDDPDLRQAELRRRRHLRRPHVQARLRAVEMPAGHVPHRVLQTQQNRGGLSTCSVT